jgi:integral membrane protein (TIGR01906 family)
MSDPLMKIKILILRILVIVLLPLAIVPGVVRLLATGPYLVFEYSKTDFPVDTFGFTHAQRLEYASVNLQYLTENRPIEFLAGQILVDGSPQYNNRELSHMQDVQNVFQKVWTTGKVAFILFLLSCLTLTFTKDGRMPFASALKTGGLLLAGLFVFIGGSALVAWRAWFVIFHQFFFIPGSWTFYYSDTLIRLFPEKFWVDAALTITSLSILVGFLVYLLGTRLTGNSPKPVKP